jgi:hypothetical protein
MKTIKFNKILMVLLAMVVATSCVKDDDFDMPNLNIEEPNINPADIIEISAVAGALAQSNDPVVTFSETGKFMVGYVVSNDEGGNFFKQIILQDKPENPTIGIKVLVDVSPLFVSYEVGRKVYIKLDGLTVGISNGVLGLGIRDGNRPGRIPFPSREEHIIRSSEVATIVPKPLTIEQFSMQNTNLMVRLSDMQFNRNELSKTFASEPGDQFDGERIMENCATNASVILSTSTFASFKGVRVPATRGSIDVILTRDFFDNFYTVYLNDPTYINLDSSERCDPDTVFCDGPSGGSDNLISENFEGITNISQLSNWINVNVSGGNTRFVLGNFSGNNYAQISGFNTGESSIDAWFVTPELDFDSFTRHQLEMDIEAAFDNGKILSVYITNSFTGDVTTTDWQLLDVDIPTGPGSGFGGFQSITPVNLSCFTGNVRIGFRYQGSDPSATTRYHLDNIKITGVQN